LEIRFKSTEYAYAIEQENMDCLREKNPSVFYRIL